MRRLAGHASRLIAAIVVLVATMGADLPGIMREAAPPSTWSITHLPATATKATISRAAAGAGVRNICTAFVVGFCAVGTAQTLITASIRDGATGAGTVLWSVPIVAPINGCVQVAQSGLNLAGTANTAMTIEFSAAGVTGSQETVSLQGYSTP